MQYLHTVALLALDLKKFELEIFLLLQRAFIRKLSSLSLCLTFVRLSTLNMGTAVELSGVGLASAVMVTNNPMYPFFQADLRLFTGGLVVERIDKSPLALILSIKSHVEVMWSVDLGEAYTNALRLIGIDAPSTSSELLDGIFIIFKLRTSFDDVDESSLSGYEKCIQYDLWNKIFPSLLPTTYLGLMIPANSRASAAFTSTHFAWKNFARMYDIPDIRGLRDDIHRIPEGLLESYLTALNHQSLTIMNSSEDDDADLLGGSLLQGYLMPRYGSNFFDD